MAGGASGCEASVACESTSNAAAPPSSAPAAAGAHEEGSTAALEAAPAARQPDNVEAVARPIVPTSAQGASNRGEAPAVSAAVPAEPLGVASGGEAPGEADEVADRRTEPEETQGHTTADGDACSDAL